MSINVSTTLMRLALWSICYGYTAEEMPASTDLVTAGSFHTLEYYLY